MEIENEENYDITAKQLYDRLESWNKDIKDSFAEGKKGKKTYLKDDGEKVNIILYF